MTHTVEVGNIGRIIASGVGRELKSAGDTVNDSTIGDIVYAACLAHDLGNPPFGHVGEYAIQSWFEGKGQSSDFVASVLAEPNYRNDFLHFDGNAQGFRIVTRLAGWRDAGGLQLTNATIGAMCKYPFASKLSSKKKFGFHNDEEKYAESIYKALGVTQSNNGKYPRHPLVFMVEAADDICYLTTDIEDAFRTKLISFTTAEELLLGICKKGNFVGRFDQMGDSEPQDKISYLRSGAISALVIAAIGAFLDKKNNIMNGEFEGNLIETGIYNDMIKKIRETCEKSVYTEARKIETESAGINIIGKLLDYFGDMIIEFKQKDLNGLSTKNRHLYLLLPEDVKLRLQHASNYQALLVLVDFISGMTDRYALELCAKITGGSPTLGRML